MLSYSIKINFSHLQYMNVSIRRSNNSEPTQRSKRLYGKMPWKWMYLCFDDVKRNGQLDDFDKKSLKLCVCVCMWTQDFHWYYKLKIKIGVCDTMITRTICFGISCQSLSSIHFLPCNACNPTVFRFHRLFAAHRCDNKSRSSFYGFLCEISFLWR